MGIIRLFKSPVNTTGIFLLLLAIGLNFNLLLAPPALSWPANSPLYQWLLSFLQQWSENNPYLPPTIYITSVFLQAIWLNVILNTNRLFERSHSLVALGYLLMMALFNVQIYWSAPFMAVFPLLYLLNTLLAAYDTHTMAEPFDIGMAVGLASLLYLPAGLLLIFAFISLFLVRVFSWRQWVICIAGLLTPYIWLTTAYYWQDNLSGFIHQQFFQVSTGGSNEGLSAIGGLVRLSLLGIIGLFVIGFLQLEFYRNMVRVRKFFTVLVYLTTISLMTFMLLEKFSFAPIVFLLVPIATILGFVFNNMSKSRLADIVLFLLLITIVGIQYLDK